MSCCPKATYKYKKILSISRKGSYMSAASILSTLSTGVDAGEDAKKHRSIERCSIRFW